MQLSSTILTALALAITSIEAIPVPAGQPLSSNVQKQSIKPYSQESLDNFNVLKYLDTVAPYIQGSGYGISKEVPYKCKVTQANLLSRHGERYPSSKKIEKINKHFQDLKNSTNIEGPAEFLEGYDFEGLEEKEAGEETAKGPYSGLLDLYAHGSIFREAYDDLYNEEVGIKFYSASGSRIVASAESFAQGFLGESYNKSSIQIIDEEDKSLGANTLTPVDTCENYDEDSNEKKLDEFDDKFLKKIAKRINSENKGLDLSKKAVKSLMYYCGVELMGEGSTEICDLFTPNDWVEYAYMRDVKYYYEKGPGNKLSETSGKPYVEAIIKALKDENLNLTLSFTHSSDIFPVLSALGIFNGDEELPIDHQVFNHPWKISNIMPMGARLILERLECEDEQDSFVRIIHNDAVIPIENYSKGPGFSTSLKDFEKYINERLDGKDFRKDCGNDDNTPQDLTIFWE
ncbi:putative acid phosphatase DIA3 [Wickerhamomyces ciferrii]|uniref:acid phosphatase n=1 Tax=Wickerhamomyces ciferrii (strain ATCC 14091 / BCRC 22168 / CBS 111 / JCM 3599 / NBRC 0793 / NRRL Y-1031 F-60-10) TaxID=1206466 RepID=K0KPP8_WICCF|nr:putative acid phosphatase DIA3 [Wickerhamomyces ciferrii]CCH44137.1 putative acid phosphatase DIA3 [Wickerhamomyces ciferrii]